MVINRFNHHHHHLLLLALCLFSFASLQIPVAALAVAPPLNISTLLHLPLNINDTNNNNNLPPPPPFQFLQDVLKALSVRQDWDLEEIRVSDVDVRNARVGTSQRYEFRVRIGKNDLELKYSDKVGAWRKFGKTTGRFRSLVNEASSKTVLNGFKVDGPFELQFDGDGDVSLSMPLNTTHTGLRRVLVGEGITVEVEGAREVSLLHESDFGLSINRSSHINEDRRQFWPFSPSLCMPLRPIRVLGSASLIAYRARNHDSYIESKFLSKDTIELLPEKCYSTDPNKSRRKCPIDSLSPRLALLEKLTRSILGHKFKRSGVTGFLKVKVTAYSLVRFQLELEKEVKDNDKYWSTLAEWRTKPRIERVRYEVVARVEEGRLKPVILKKVRPFITAESATWSTLMSNISFTKFPSVLVPPEALTLDVKW